MPFLEDMGMEGLTRAEHPVKIRPLSSMSNWPVVSWESRNGKDNGNYYDGLYRIHSFIPNQRPVNRVKLYTQNGNFPT